MPLFDPATTIAFFTGAQPTALTKGSLFQLTEEGIDTSEDLKEFMEDRLKAIFHNFQKSAEVMKDGWIPHRAGTFPSFCQV